MQDLIRIYHEAIINTTISGPVNACAPNPAKFKDFLDHLREFKKVLVVPFPVFALKFLLGETSDVLLFSQRMIPVKLLSMNFSFSYPDLKDALREVFSR
jgi:NAD dependent epimerase/dehydratase family enzyme